MIIDVHVPQLSESVAEATLVSWNKKLGEAVSRDENLIDIETDKVVLERPSPADGVLIEIVKRNGDTVVSGELIARIDTEATASVASSVPVAKETPVPPPAAKPAAAGAQAELSAAERTGNRIRSHRLCAAVAALAPIPRALPAPVASAEE